MDDDDFFDPYAAEDSDGDGDFGGFGSEDSSGNAFKLKEGMRSDGRFLEEAEALTALGDASFCAHLALYCEVASADLPPAEAVGGGGETGARSEAGVACGVEYIDDEECYAVWVSAAAPDSDRIHYLPDAAWCEQDLYGDAASGDGDEEDGGEKRAASHSPHFIEAGVGFAGNSVVSAANARMLVQKDVDELNAISGVQAGFHFSEHSSDEFPIKIWIGLDFEVRYGLSSVRADAWMTDPTYWLVQRLDFGAAYTRDARGPQVLYATCGASDAIDFNRVRLTVDPAGDAAAPLEPRDLKPFGVQWLFHHAAKRIFVGETAWPPFELELRPWEILQAQRDAINPAFRPIAETCSVSGQLAEALYHMAKKRLGRDPELTEVFDIWSSERETSEMQTLVDTAAARAASDVEALALEAAAMAAGTGTGTGTGTGGGAAATKRSSPPSTAATAVVMPPAIALQRSSSSGPRPGSSSPRSMRPPVLRRTLSSGSGGGGVSGGGAGSHAGRFAPPALKRMNSSAQHLSNLVELQEEYAETLAIDLADAKAVLTQLKDGALGAAGADAKVSMSAVLGSLYKHQARLPRPTPGSGAALSNVSATLDMTQVAVSSVRASSGGESYDALHACDLDDSTRWSSRGDGAEKSITLTLAPDSDPPVDLALLYIDVANFGPDDGKLHICVRVKSSDAWVEIVAESVEHRGEGQHTILELAGDTLGIPCTKAPFNHSSDVTSIRIRQLMVKTIRGSSTTMFSIWNMRAMAEPPFVAAADPIAAALAELTAVAAIRTEEDRDVELEQLCLRWRMTNHANVARVEMAKLRPFIYAHAARRRFGGDLRDTSAPTPLARSASGRMVAGAAPPPMLMRQTSSGAFGRRATQRAYHRAHAIEVGMCERNVLVRVLHAIDFAIDRANTHCIITGKKHKYETVYPSACDDPDAEEYALAQLAYTDLGVGLELGTQFLHQPELVTLLISFLHAAANGGRVHLLYPGKVQAVGSDDRFDPLEEGNSGQTFPRLQQCLKSIPPFAQMKKWAKAGTGSSGENVLLHQLNKIDPLLLPLLRWMVVSSSLFSLLRERGLRSSLSRSLAASLSRSLAPSFFFSSLSLSLVQRHPYITTRFFPFTIIISSLSSS
jgi:hypothetical protein